MHDRYKVDLSPVTKLIGRLGDRPDVCITILQGIQAFYGYLPAEALDYVTSHTRISRRQICGVASFYSQFRFAPVGRHVVRVCRGTACHVNGAERVSAAVHKTLHINGEETTRDGKFTLEKVACLGCCSLAPVMMIDETTYGRLDSRRALRVLKNLHGKSVAPDRSHD